MADYPVGRKTWLDHGPRGTGLPIPGRCCVQELYLFLIRPLSIPRIFFNVFREVGLYLHFTRWFGWWFRYLDLWPEIRSKYYKQPQTLFLPNPARIPDPDAAFFLDLVWFDQPAVWSLDFELNDFKNATHWKIKNKTTEETIKPRAA